MPRVTCPKCGHGIFLYMPELKKSMCTWCGHFLSSIEEFKFQK